MSNYRTTCKKGHDLSIHRRTFGGKQKRCGLCQKINNDKLYKTRTKKDNRLKLQKWRLKTYFKMTVEDFENMVLSQKGLCAICKKPPMGRWHFLHVDHDHKSGKVRGLLCNSCNLGLGKFQDDPDLLRYAASYLEKNDGC